MIINEKLRSDNPSVSSVSSVSSMSINVASITTVSPDRDRIPRTK